jgi:phosphoglycerate kinase
MTSSSSELIPPTPEGQPRKRNVCDVLETIGTGKTVFIRVDFNVPMNDQGTITDDSRIVKALPTIQYVMEHGCNAILASHMGRPSLVQKGKDDDETKQEKEKLSLKPVADHLSQLLGKDVLFAEDCMSAEDTISQLPKEGGGVVLLNNLRFYKQEEKNEGEFAKKLASYADAYINDAFGT